MKLTKWLAEGDLQPEQKHMPQIRQLWREIHRIYRIPARATHLPKYANTAMGTGVATIIGETDTAEAAQIWQVQQEALRANWAAVQGIVLASLIDDRPQTWIARRIGINRETVRRMMVIPAGDKGRK